MKKYFHPVYVLLAGVLTAQVLFTCLVYFSDISLYQNLLAIKNSGYMIIPNELVMPSLRSISPAICGGIFFSLTTGAGLSFITFFIVIAWRWISGNYKVLAGLLIIAVGFLFFKFNFNFPITLICTFIVCTTAFAALIFFPEKDKNSGSILPVLSAHLGIIIVIVLIWVPVTDKDVFISIRDNLLLSNSIGQKINNFYYKYTLYPAETFKSLYQKLLKSCRIRIVDNKILHYQIEQLLISEDYLPVNDKFLTDLTPELSPNLSPNLSPDLTIDYENDSLIFQYQNKIIHQCSTDEFLKGSEEILELISDKTDHNKFLRKITFLSLISASPLLCYIILHAFFMVILFFIKSKTFRITGASIACLITFTLPAVSFYYQPPLDIKKDDIAKYLKSVDWQERVGAFKAISEQNLSVDRFIETDQLNDFIQSPMIAERYWLAKVLGSSRSIKSYPVILKLLDDPQPNVVCMAMYSLGKQHQSNAESEIIRRIKTYDHWYVQWYAYKALKRLGWTQKK